MYQEAQLDSLSDGKHNSGIWTLMIHLYCDYYGHYLTHSPVANRPRRRQFFVYVLAHFRGGGVQRGTVTW